MRQVDMEGEGVETTRRKGEWFYNLGYIGNYLPKRGKGLGPRNAFYAIIIRPLEPGDYLSWRHGCRWSFTSADGPWHQGGFHFGRFEIYPEGRWGGDDRFWCINGEAQARQRITDYFKEWAKYGDRKYRGEGTPTEPLSIGNLLFYSEHPGIQLAHFIIPIADKRQKGLDRWLTSR